MIFWGISVVGVALEIASMGFFGSSGDIVEADLTSGGISGRFASLIFPFTYFFSLPNPCPIPPIAPHSAPVMGILIGLNPSPLAPDMASSPAP